MNARNKTTETPGMLVAKVLGGTKAAAVLWPVAALPVVQLKAIDIVLEFTMATTLGAIIATRAIVVAGFTIRGLEE